ncbi:hypothetical protein [Lactiplantibacillus plantarum]|nr:hypothetical protein [Lactiplantibacillus plantarum]
MNTEAFWLTWLLLSIALKLYSNHKMSKQLGKMHKLNKTIKGDNK